LRDALFFLCIDIFLLDALLSPSGWERFPLPFHVPTFIRGWQFLHHLRVRFDRRLRARRLSFFRIGHGTLTSWSDAAFSGPGRLMHFPPGRVLLRLLVPPARGFHSITTRFSELFAFFWLFMTLSPASFPSRTSVTPYAITTIPRDDGSTCFGSSCNTACSTGSSFRCRCFFRSDFGIRSDFLMSFRSRPSSFANKTLFAVRPAPLFHSTIVVCFFIRIFFCRDLSSRAKRLLMSKTNPSHSELCCVFCFGLFFFGLLGWRKVPKGGDSPARNRSPCSFHCGTGPDLFPFFATGLFFGDATLGVSPCYSMVCQSLR